MRYSRDVFGLLEVLSNFNRFAKVTTGKWVEACQQGKDLAVHTIINANVIRLNVQIATKNHRKRFCEANFSSIRSLFILYIIALFREAVISVYLPIHAASLVLLNLLLNHRCFRPIHLDNVYTNDDLRVLIRASEERSLEIPRFDDLYKDDDDENDENGDSDDNDDARSTNSDQDLFELVDLIIAMDKLQYSGVTHFLAYSRHLSGNCKTH